MLCGPFHRKSELSLDLIFRDTDRDIAPRGKAFNAAADDLFRDRADFR